MEVIFILGNEALSVISIKGSLQSDTVVLMQGNVLKGFRKVLEENIKRVFFCHSKEYPLYRTSQGNNVLLIRFMNAFTSAISIMIPCEILPCDLYITNNSLN